MLTKDTFPDVVRIELVGLCNFKCIHCPTGIQPNRRQLLATESFNMILEQFAANDFIPRVVVLYHGGEPLLNKNLPEYIRILKKLGVSKTVITTNASLLTEEYAEQLILAGLDEMKVSFDGESAEDNNTIRKNGDFYANAKNVKNFCQQQKKLGRDNPKIIINNVRVYNRRELEDFRTNGSASLKPSPTYIMDFFGEERDQMKFRSSPAMVWADFKNFQNFETFFFENENPTYCDLLFETFTILSNGDVVSCCYDLQGKIILGNVFEKSMFEIWNSEQFAELRNDFRKQKYNQLCGNCGVVSPRYLCRD